jgi:hypothetical protein
MGGHGDKPSAILPFRICLPREPEIGFIDQRRGLKSMVRAFVQQISRGEPTELAIEERDEPLRRLSRGRPRSTRLCAVDDEKLPGPGPFQDKGITSSKNKLIPRRLH